MAEATGAAVKKALKDQEDLAKQNAERSKLEETERLKLEKKDETTRADTAEGRATRAETELALYRTLTVGGYQLVDPDFIPMIRSQAQAKIDAAPGLTLDQAVRTVLTEKPHLVRQLGTGDPPAPPQGGAQTPPGTPPAAPPGTAPSTTPVPQPGTGTPAPPETPHQVDYLTANKEEWNKRKRELGLMH